MADRHGEAAQRARHMDVPNRSLPNGAARNVLRFRRRARNSNPTVWPLREARLCIRR